MAWEVKSDATADAAAAQDEFQRFAEKVADEFGIDLLATAAVTPDWLLAEFPTGLLPDAADEA